MPHTPLGGHDSATLCAFTDRLREKKFVSYTTNLSNRASMICDHINYLLRHLLLQCQPPRPQGPKNRLHMGTWKSKASDLKFQVMIPQYRPFLKIGHTQEELNTSEEQINWNQNKPSQVSHATPFKKNVKLTKSTRKNTFYTRDLWRPTFTFWIWRIVSHMT